MARVISNEQIRQLVRRMGGLGAGNPGIGPVNGGVPNFSTPVADQLLNRPVDPATGVQAPLNPGQIGQAIKELSRGSLRQYNLTERDIRRLYRGVNFDLRAVSDPYMQQLIRSLLDQGLTMDQIMSDPSFVEYNQSLREQLGTGRQNMATDLAWVEKFRNINRDSFNALLLQNSLGVPAAAATGGGGGGGGGFRRFGRRGGGRSSGGGDEDTVAANPVGETDINKDASEEGKWYHPLVNQIMAGIGSLPPGVDVGKYLQDIKDAPTEKDLVEYLAYAQGQRRYPGETRRQFRRRKQGVAESTEMWGSTGGETGGPNAGLPDLRQLVEDVTASNKTLEGALETQLADVGIRGQELDRVLTPQQQMNIVKGRGSYAEDPLPSTWQRKITPEVLAFLQASAAGDRQEDAARAAHDTNTYDPILFEQRLANQKEYADSLKALQEKGISPGLISGAIKPSAYGGGSSAVGITPSTLPEFTTPKEAYLDYLREKAATSRESLTEGEKQILLANRQVEAASMLSPNWFPNITVRSLKDASSTDWSNLNAGIRLRPGGKNAPMGNATMPGEWAVPNYVSGPVATEGGGKGRRRRRQRRQQLLEQQANAVVPSIIGAPSGAAPTGKRNRRRNRRQKAEAVAYVPSIVQALASRNMPHPTMPSGASGTRPSILPTTRPTPPAPRYNLPEAPKPIPSISYTNPFRNVERNAGIPTGNENLQTWGKYTPISRPGSAWPSGQETPNYEAGYRDIVSAAVESQKKAAAEAAARDAAAKFAKIMSAAGSVTPSGGWKPSGKKGSSGTAFPTGGMGMASIAPQVPKAAQNYARSRIAKLLKSPAGYSYRRGSSTYS